MTTNPAPLWQWSACELGRAYGARRVSPIDALDSVLARLDAVNPAVNAVVETDRTRARQMADDSARRWREGRPLSPLDGVPITIKDNLVVAGLRCTWGSLLYEGYRPDHDERPVARLRAAGMVFVGKTNVPEFTLHGYTDNRLFGPTRNPWRLALTPGGSSGGAVAAVACGVGPVALGTDGGGSIRRPCAHTGLLGFKPSRGVIRRGRGLPELLGDFEMVGPIARRVDDLVAMMAILADEDGPWAPSPADATTVSGGVGPRAATASAGLDDAPRIAYLRDWSDSPIDPRILRVVDDLAARLSALGARVETGPMPAIVRRFNETAWPALSQQGLRDTLAGIAHSGPGSNPPPGRSPALRARLGAPIAGLAEAADALTPADLASARAIVAEMRVAIDRLFADADWLLLPATAAQPWPAEATHPTTIDGRPVGPRGHAIHTAFANALGLPAIALPAGAADGLPIGFQLVGRAGRDAALCGLARQLEARNLWAVHWPDIC